MMTDDIVYGQKKLQSKAGERLQKDENLTVSEIHRATTICIYVTVCEERHLTPRKSISSFSYQLIVFVSFFY